MPTLLEISEDLAAIEQAIEEAGGEATPETEHLIGRYFDDLLPTAYDKMDNYAALIREMELRSNARKEEAKRLAERARIDADSAKWLKNNLHNFFVRHDLKKVETQRFKLTRQKHGGQAPLELDLHPDELPSEYQKWTVDYNRDAIRKALEEGKYVPGAKIGERGEGIRIR
jgi:hypothetical protein